MVISGAGKALSWARDRVPHPKAGDPDQAPAGPEGPVVAYARILGGDVLFLDVEGLGEATLALRQLRSGEVVDPGFEPAPAATATGTPLKLDLLQAGDRLGAREKRTYALVARDPGGRADDPRPVPWTGTDPATPIQPDSTSDLRWSFRLGRGEQALRLAVRPLAPAAHIRDIGVDGETLVLGFAVAGHHAASGGAVEVVDGDGVVTASLAPTPDGDLLVVRLPPTALDGPAGTAVTVRFAAGDAGLPLRRSHGDLREPGDAVAMPIIQRHDGPAAGVLRVAYRADGELVVRRAAPSRTEAAE